MGWFSKFRKSSVGSFVGSSEQIIDVTDSSVGTVSVTLSIHESTESEERFGSALCMISRSDHMDTTGSVVSIGRRPHQITREHFRDLIQEAAETGHLTDGFLEIEAVIDIAVGTIIWHPEDGDGVALPYLEEVVENTIASLVETNIFGEWFSPSSVTRRAARVVHV